MRADRALGPALSVRVRNESYWYASRATLGGANHAYRDVVRTEHPRHGTLFEGFFFRMMPRATDYALAPEVSRDDVA